MAHKPRIKFRLIEDRNESTCNVNGISVEYQLSLADFGGERNCKLRFHVFLSDIDLDCECELCLNIEAASLLADKLAAFLKANVVPQQEPYV